MARSTTGRAPRRTAAQRAAEAAEVTTQTPVEPVAEYDQESMDKLNHTESDNLATKANEQAQEATDMTTDTIDETAQTDAVADEQATAAETGESTETEAKAAPSDDITDFKAVVATALAERDQATGTFPEVQLENVKAAYRNLPGAKAKNAAKKHLNDELRNAVNTADILTGQAIMVLVDLTLNAGTGTKAPAERKPVDPTANFVDQMTVLNLAYNLRRADVPDGVETDGAEGAFAKVDALVSEHSEAAEKYYTWVTSKADDKGDEPEVSGLVKRAVKAALGKAATAGRSASSSPRPASDGVRRNVRTHIGQVFADKEPGTFLKVAEIANAETAEYPEGNCSPGAITAALKSEKGVEGFQLTHNESGVAGATKL